MDSLIMCEIERTRDRDMLKQCQFSIYDGGLKFIQFLRVVNIKLIHQTACTWIAVVGRRIDAVWHTVTPLPA